MVSALNELEQLWRTALGLRLVLDRAQSSGSESQTTFIDAVVSDPWRISVESVFNDAIKWVGANAKSSAVAERQQVIEKTLTLLPAINCVCESGLRHLASLGRPDLMPVACWSVHEALSLLTAHSSKRNRLCLLVDRVERLAVLPKSGPQLEALATEVKSNLGVFEDGASAGDDMLGVFAGFVEKWEMLLSVDDSEWHHPWWWWVVDVCRMSANAGEHRGANATEWHRAFGERVRMQIATVLQRSMVQLTPVRGCCGTPGAIELLMRDGGRAACGDETSHFRFRVGEMRRSGQGQLRSIAGLGYNAADEPVYCTICHESAGLTLKRASKAHAEYGMQLGWDDLVLAKSNG